MTKEEKREQNRKYMKNLKENHPEKFEMYRRNNNAYRRHRYYTDEEFRQDLLQRNRDRYAKERADKELCEQKRTEARKRYRNDDEYRRSIQKSAVEYYHRKHPNAKYRYEN